jgi:hypothetical protein
MTSDKLFIPTKRGYESKIMKLPDNIFKIQTGYYRVKISCDNENFNKIFSYSKKHTYDNKALYQAMKYKDEYDIKIELNTDLKYNCLLYNGSDCVTGKRIFEKWFNWISELKTEFPKNKLVKAMASRLHGYLSQEHTTQWMTREEIEENYECSQIGADPTKYRYIVKEYKYFGDVEKLRLIDTKKSNPYGFNCRMKAFLTSFARNKVSRLICNDLDNVIRVCIDSVCMKKKIKEFDNNTELKHEEKSSGKVLWISATQYVKLLDDKTLEFHGNISKKDIEKIEKRYSEFS